MPKWVARIAIEVTFDAKDPNEADEIGRFALRAPESYGGFPITARSHAWVAVLPDEEEASNQESKP